MSGVVPKITHKFGDLLGLPGKISYSERERFRGQSPEETRCKLTSPFPVELHGMHLLPLAKGVTTREIL